MQRLEATKDKTEDKPQRAVAKQKEELETKGRTTEPKTENESLHKETSPRIEKGGMRKGMRNPFHNTSTNHESASLFS